MSVIRTLPFWKSGNGWVGQEENVGFFFFVFFKVENAYGTLSKLDHNNLFEIQKNIPSYSLDASVS